SRTRDTIEGAPAAERTSMRFGDLGAELGELALGCVFLGVEIGDATVERGECKRRRRRCLLHRRGIDDVASANLVTVTPITCLTRVTCFAHFATGCGSAVRREGRSNEHEPHECAHSHTVTSLRRPRSAANMPSSIPTAIIPATTYQGRNVGST